MEFLDSWAGINGFIRLLAALVLSSAIFPASARSDTLRDALALAYETNPTLLAARAQQRAADEEFPIQASQGRPNINITANYIDFVRSPNSFTAPIEAFLVVLI